VEVLVLALDHRSLGGRGPGHDVVLVDGGRGGDEAG
jgi:hypothetical protein